MLRANDTELTLKASTAEEAEQWAQDLKKYAAQGMLPLSFPPLLSFSSITHTHTSFLAQQKKSNIRQVLSLAEAL